MTQKASSANPEPPYILALDVGTSSTRALLFDAIGNPLPQWESMPTIVRSHP